MRPDGVKVNCVEPPDEVIAKETSANADIAVNRIGELVKGSAGVRIDPQRVRQELPADVTAFEVIEYRICAQYGNGVLTPAEYKAFIEQVLPVLKAPPPARGSSRIRIWQVVFVGTPNPAGWPVVNIYYDNAGTMPARGIVVRYAGGISAGQLPPEKIEEAQNNLLSWSEWGSAMAGRSRYEMHPGDQGEFTTIPPENNDLARDVLANFSNIIAGRMTLYIFIAFKYRDESMPANTLGVTEDCFWFSGPSLARHNCGRGRAFRENK